MAVLSMMRFLGDDFTSKGMARVVNRGREVMLKIDTIESTSEIVLSLHGRLAGPWVDELESQWRRAEAMAGERRLAVDLTNVTGIDGAARYLLQLMRVRNVSLVGACLAIRASLDDDPGVDRERAMC
jgi:hypothetical protein